MDLLVLNGQKYGLWTNGGIMDCGGFGGARVHNAGVVVEYLMDTRGVNGQRYG